MRFELPGLILDVFSFRTRLAPGPPQVSARRQKGHATPQVEREANRLFASDSKRCPVVGYFFDYAPLRWDAYVAVTPVHANPPYHLPPGRTDG